MKKTMFITSVIMVVVLAIALTTSSLAWFSAGGAVSVRTTDISITTAQATTSAGLQISGNPSNEASWKSGTRVDVVSSSVRATNKPAALIGSKEGDDMTHEELYNAIVKNTSAGHVGLMGNTVFTDDANATKFKGTAYEVTPYKGMIYCRNSGYTDGDVTCTIQNIVVSQATSETGNHDAALWIAVFDVSGISPVLVAINGNTISSYDSMAWCAAASGLNEGTLVGTVSAIDISDDLVQPDTTVLDGGEDVLNTDTNTYNFQAGAYHTYEIYAWFDGKSLNNQNTDTVVTFDLLFTIADHQQNP